MILTLQFLAILAVLALAVLGGHQLVRHPPAAWSRAMAVLTRRWWLLAAPCVVIPWAAAWAYMHGDWYGLALVGAFPVVALAMFQGGNLLFHELSLRAARRAEQKPNQFFALDVIANVYAKHGFDCRGVTVFWINADRLKLQPDGAERFPITIWPGIVQWKSGVTRGAYAVTVAWPSYAKSFADVVLAHELLHLAQARKGIVDYAHERKDWELVEEANEALRREGL